MKPELGLCIKFRVHPNNGATAKAGVGLRSDRSDDRRHQGVGTSPELSTFRKLSSPYPPSYFLLRYICKCGMSQLTSLVID